MPRYRTAVALIGAAAAAAGVLIGAGAPAGASPGPPAAALAGSVAPFTAHTRVTGRVAGSDRLTVQVWLRPRVAAAARFAAAVSTPGSPLFHGYLSPGGYTARFGPSRGAAAAVGSWLRSRGFTGISTDPQRSYVRATASVARIEAAFGTRLMHYRATGDVNAGSHRLRANEGPVKVPATLAGDILGVTGLDNAAPILPLEQSPGMHDGAGTTAAAASTASGVSGGNCSTYYGQHVLTGQRRAEHAVAAAGLPAGRGAHGDEHPPR